MDNTSTTIQARLEAVQAKQAEWQQEFDAVREDARQECLRLCKLFNFTTSDLELEASGKKTAKKATKLPPKFKNPEGEETWTGRGGHKPQWFVDALEAGYTEEDMHQVIVPDASIRRPKAQAGSPFGDPVSVG